MAGWTYTSTATPIELWARNDGGQKVTTFPAVGAAGQAPWWRDFAHQVAQQYALEVRRRNVAGVTNLVVTAQNGSGDTAGVGALTIVLTTS